MKYMEVRKAERSGWPRAGQNRGTSKDLKAVSEALSYLQRKGLSTVEDLANFIETSGKSAADYRKQMKPKAVSYTHLVKADSLHHHQRLAVGRLKADHHAVGDGKGLAFNAVGADDAAYRLFDAEQMCIRDSFLPF